MSSRKNQQDSWSSRNDSGYSSSTEKKSNGSYNDSERSYGRGGDENKRYRSNNGSRDRYSSNSGSSWGNKSNNSSYSSWSSNNGPSKPIVENSNIEFKKIFLSNFKMTEAEATQYRSENQMKVKGKDIPSPFTSFEDVELFPKAVLDVFKQSNFTKPTPIQGQGWSMALSGRDMVGIAQTGSGKTLSFVLPALVHASDQEKLRPNDGPIVLVLAPTRELVIQIEEVFSTYTKFFRLRSTCVYGGVKPFEQTRALRNGVEVLVATPGRLIDLYNQGCFSLSRVSFLVLDEADRMLDMGFEPQLKQIIPKTNKNRQTLMWSATWPVEVQKLAMSYMNDYIQVNIGEESLSANKNIEQEVIVMESRSKRDKLVQTLNGHTTDRGSKKFIIFCNTKKMCDGLEYYLQDRRYSAVAIHGDKTQGARDSIIGSFKDGKKKILIATDVAARGLDVKDVYMVINFDFPKQCEDYVHRIGRTARGNTCTGKSISFFTDQDSGCARELIQILEESKSQVPSELRELVPRPGGNNNNGYGGGGYNRRPQYRRWG